MDQFGTRWCPSSLAKLVCNPNNMVEYGRCIYTLVNNPTYNWGGTTLYLGSRECGNFIVSRSWSIGWLLRKHGLIASMPSWLRDHIHASGNERIHASGNERILAWCESNDAFLSTKGEFDLNPNQPKQWPPIHHFTRHFIRCALLLVWDFISVLRQCGSSQKIEQWFTSQYFGWILLLYSFGIFWGLLWAWMGHADTSQHGRQLLNISQHCQGQRRSKGTRHPHLIPWPIPWH